MSWLDKIKRNKDPIKRCTLDRWWYDYERDAYRRHRDKKYPVDDLPFNAVPVTGARNTYAVMSLEAPPRAPFGQDAIILYVWSEDKSFETAFEHFSGSDNPPLPWTKIALIGGVAILGAFILFKMGILG